MIAIIDIGIGNVGSMANAIKRLSYSYCLARTPEDLTESVTRIIFPGVGSFSHASEILNKTGMADKIIELVQKGTPLLGVCLGMQLLAKIGFEGGEAKGLGLVNASVCKIELNDKTLNIPHMGWNDVRGMQGDLFYGIEDGACFYFVHSYECKVNDESISTAFTNHGRDIIAYMGKNNVYGVQFHPEKSQALGLALLRNFVERC